MEHFLMRLAVFTLHITFYTRKGCQIKINLLDFLTITQKVFDVERKFSESVNIIKYRSTEINSGV